ncbi:MAG: threonylcarbamoyl-AMP synthase [Ruminococcaceae bacterium]|nr:threonylcarbamoyl-AMP synthase [Oscillospiraceae bacterium]
MTEIIKMTQEPDFEALKTAALALADGSLVAIPTETVYGLGANAFIPESVDEIFKVKGRPQDNPLIVHIDNLDMLSSVVSEVPKIAIPVMERFWPGPLTLIMKKNPLLPSNVTAGLDTVAVRMPSLKIARLFITLAGVPVVAPSANLSGRPSPTKYEHVLEDFDGKIPYIIDGGASEIGLESTVLDLTSPTPVILRPGGVSLEELSEVLENVKYDEGLINESVKPKSPGMKYKHYAPKAEMFIFEGETATSKIEEMLSQLNAEGKKTGVITMAGIEFDSCHVLRLSSEPYTYAAGLFDALRQFDALGVDVILAETFKETDGLKAAIKNRIYKSAGGKVILC